MYEIRQDHPIRPAYDAALKWCGAHPPPDGDDELCVAASVGWQMAQQQNTIERQEGLIIASLLLAFAIVYFAIKRVAGSR